MSFTRSGLSIGKNRTIIASQHFFDEWCDHRHINLRLTRVRSKCAIECKLFGISIFDKHFTTGYYTNCFQGTSVSLTFIRWSKYWYLEYRQNVKCDVNRKTILFIWPFSNYVLDVMECGCVLWKFVDYRSYLTRRYTWMFSLVLRRDVDVNAILLVNNTSEYLNEKHKNYTDRLYEFESDGYTKRHFWNSKLYNALNCWIWCCHLLYFFVSCNSWLTKSAGSSKLPYHEILISNLTRNSLHHFTVLLRSYAIACIFILPRRILWWSQQFNIVLMRLRVKIFYLIF